MLNNIYAQRIFSDGELGGDIVGVPIEAPASLTLSLVGPNPARSGQLRLRLSLGSEGPASLELFDVAGRRIGARALHGFNPGTHTIDLGEGQRLASGLYLVRLRQGDVASVVRVTVLNSH